MNNIHIEGSTIGVVNTGSIQAIDQTVTALHNSGAEDLAHHLLTLTQSVLDNKEIDPQAQADTVEILRELATKSTLQKENRPKAVIKPLLLQLSTLLGGITSLRELWEQAQPVFEQFFNIF